MSRNSGVDELLSLPSGGGAVEGLGETFTADPFTGTGRYAIPLALPAGRAGLEPDLELRYGTGEGNGPFGLGWRLSLPGIARRTSKGVPRYRDGHPDPAERDTFVLSGAEELVAVGEPEDGVARYRPRTEGSFARIERVRDGASDYWRVRAPDGLVSLYGTPEAAGEDPAVVAHPDDRGRAFAWRLSRTTDPFGNRIVYDHLRDTGRDGPRHWDQLYLERIRYVDYEEDGETRFLVSVRFAYEERPDAFARYRSGFEVRTRLRCRRIEIRTHADDDRLVRAYELRYLDDLVAEGERDPAEAPANGASLLARVQAVGHDEDAEEGRREQALPPLELGYARFEPERRRLSAVEGELPLRSLAAPSLELADVSGDGLPDLVELGGTARYWRNLGEGRFDRPRTMAEAPSGLRLADPGVQLLDADGDGRLELLVTREGLTGYYPLRRDGGWDRRGFRRQERAPSVDLDAPAVALVDLDGDGVTDALRSGRRMECFLGDPERGWRAARPAEGDVDGLDLADPNVKLADLTGDGLRDLATVEGGVVSYWPSLGHGRWGPRLVMSGARLPPGFDPGRALLGDVDGDGLADLVYVDHGRVLLWVNRAGGSWSEPIEIRGTPPVAHGQVVRLVDLHGTGVAGILWSADADASGRGQARFLDVAGGRKPYLLDEVDNHMGAVTRVAYAPSSRLGVERDAPAGRWGTTLPFPVQVVARVEMVDALSGGKLTTEYAYHHGHWDGEEREFRGFGLVEEYDTESFEDYHGPGLHGDRSGFARPGDDRPGFVRLDGDRATHFSPPTLTRRWFHLGPVRDATGDWGELDHGDEFWSGDPPLLSRPESTIQLLRSLPPRDRRDALRALRGQPLRTERYALDGSDREDRPYEVVERAHGLTEVDGPGAGDAAGRRVFFPHERARRTTRWERGDDPMTRLRFTDDHDDYGQPRRRTRIACPRGWRDLDDAPDEPFLATRTRLAYAQRDDAESLIVDREARRVRSAIREDPSRTARELAALADDDDAALEILGETLRHYDERELGALGDHGAETRVERLVLTDALLAEAFPEGREPPDDAPLPPYLRAEPEWSEDYPAGFRELLGDRAGFVRRDGGDLVGGLYAATTRRYDVEGSAGPARGLVRAVADPLGNETTIDHDRFGLLPVRARDPAGLATRVDNDYRVLQPALLTGPNGERTRYAFTPLGLVASVAELGREGEGEGDDPESPSTRHAYDLDAFDRRGAPVSVRTTRRARRAGDAGAGSEEGEGTVVEVDHADGFGRVLQTRAQCGPLRFGGAARGDGVLPPEQDDAGPAEIVGVGAEPDEPHVVVSGARTYDNKGRVVERYAPYLATGWGYAPPGDGQRGEPTRTFYDPRGEVVREVEPSGAERRIVRGVPDDLRDPERFAPSPWEVAVYDPNDNAGRTHGDGDERHWDTPTSRTLDALGRTVLTVERTGPDAGDRVETRFEHNLRGEVVAVTDALGRVAVRRIHDLAGRLLRSESIDAGVRLRARDAAGNVVERRDGKGARSLGVRDARQRPLRRWARDRGEQRLTLRERWVYGDDATEAPPAEEARGAHLLGRLHRRYDGAGLRTVERYDLDGHPVEETRAVVADGLLLASLPEPGEGDGEPEPFRVDWEPPEGTDPDEHARAILDETVYRVSSTYDALERLVARQLPEDAGGRRHELRLGYTDSGEVERVALDGEALVERIAYNARGQRTLLARGNGILTRYAHDPETFRLARLRSERFAEAGGDGAGVAYRVEGPPLQDLGYDRDRVGNVTRVRARVEGAGVPGSELGPDALDREFAYDPLYRLVSATGREIPPPERPPWDPGPRRGGPDATQAYREEHRYDAVGNLVRLDHEAAEGAFVRRYDLVEGRNRLAHLTVEGTGERAVDCAHDGAGNLVEESGARRLSWDADDRLAAVRAEGDSGATLVLQLHDGDGRRVKRLVRRPDGSVRTAVSIDGAFEHRRWEDADGSGGEQRVVHVPDDARRIALVRLGEAHPDGDGPAVQHHLDDHLGSSVLVLDEDGEVAGREEYAPYGETTLGGLPGKRFRFTGKERDEDTGLADHGARHYAPWLARWVSADPAGMVDGVNLYAYVAGNPMTAVDPTGQQARSTEDAPQSPDLTGAADGGPDAGQSPADEQPLDDDGLDSAWVTMLLGSVGGARLALDQRLQIRLSNQLHRLRVTGSDALSVSVAMSSVRLQATIEGSRPLHLLTGGLSTALRSASTGLSGIGYAMSVQRAVEAPPEERPAVVAREAVGHVTSTAGIAFGSRAGAALGSAATGVRAGGQVGARLGSVYGVVGLLGGAILGGTAGGAVGMLLEGPVGQGAARVESRWERFWREAEEAAVEHVDEHRVPAPRGGSRGSGGSAPSSRPRDPEEELWDEWGMGP